MVQHYSYDTPEGETRPLGMFTSEAAAKRFMARKLNADIRALCVGPYPTPAPEPPPKRGGFLLVGFGCWGWALTLDEAKANFKAYGGGRLTDGYEIFPMGPDTTFTGTDGFGRLYFEGPVPHPVPVAPKGKKR